jgi:hypothetical protein
MIFWIAFGSNSVLRAEESATACLHDLVVPVYGGLPWQAQLTGVVVSKVTVAADGAPLDIQLNGSHQALNEWVKGALKRATFSKKCAGQTIQLTFRYQLEGEKQRAPTNKIRIKGPGVFEITSNPPLLKSILD